MRILIRTIALGLGLSGGFSQSYAAETVKVGIFVNDIQNLDLKTHSYQLDFYLWFKWKNLKFDPSQTYEFMNGYETWGHTREKIYETPIKLPTGEFYQVIRNQGRFSSKFDLSHYPFDRHKIAISVEDNRFEGSDLTYGVDVDKALISDLIIIPGFLLGRPNFRVSDMVYPTNFGDVRVAKTIYPRLQLEIPIFRPRWPYLIKTMLPVFCVVFCAALMILFQPSHVDSRVGIGITALLTIVALQITTNEDLPEVSYLVLIEKVYLATYIFIIFGLAVVLKTTWLLDAGKERLRRAVRFDYFCLSLLTLIYFVSIALLIRGTR